MPDSSGRSAGGRWLLPVTGGLVAVEGLVLVVLGGYMVVAGLFGDPDTRTGAEVGGLLALAAGAGLVLVGRGLARGRRWAKAPGLVAQMLALPVAWELVQGGRVVAGLPLLLAAAVVVVAVLHPAIGGRIEG